MPAWGKIVGAVAGFATGQPLVAVVGLLLGHQFDRGFAERAGAPEGAGRTVLPEPYIKALFQIVGHLAKADGRVTEDEIRAARALMHRLNLGPAQIRRAISAFEEGKQPSFPLASAVKNLRRGVVKSADERRLFVRLLAEVSLSKSRLHQRERAKLWVVCKELGIGRVEMAQLEAMLRAQRAFRTSPAGTADAERVDRAYAVLGVTKQSSNAEIKTAYRRLMNKHHPDKIAGSNVAAEEVAAAEKRTRDIRTAYETLKSRRLIR